MSEKIYRVQMNSKGMPNFSTAVEVADRPQMSDLINGREMLKRLQVDLCYGIACKDCTMCTEDGGCRVEEWIDKFPSADRPQGEWIVSDKDSICSVCGKDEAEFICGTEDWYGYGLSNFCPNCGCRMRKENE